MGQETLKRTTGWVTCCPRSRTHIHSIHNVYTSTCGNGHEHLVKHSVKLQSTAGEYGIRIVKHPTDVPMPDMTKLDIAFQAYDPDDIVQDAPYESKMRLNKPIYLAGHNPHMLARAVMDAGRQVCSGGYTALLETGMSDLASNWTASLSCMWRRRVQGCCALCFTPRHDKTLAVAAVRWAFHLVVLIVCLQSH